MARRGRIYIAGLSVHVITRGHNHISIFECVEDYEVFLMFLVRAATRHGGSVHAFVLMTNHIHLMVTPCDRDALPRMMHEVDGRYAQYYNRRYKRIGTLWNGRHRSLLIGDERYWLTCLRYIAQNPVRARMVQTPEEYRWSSHRAHAFGAPAEWLVEHRIYTELGASADERQAAYRAICGVPLTEAQLVEQRQPWQTNVTGVSPGAGPGPAPHPAIALTLYPTAAEDRPAASGSRPGAVLILPPHSRS